VSEPKTGLKIRLVARLDVKGPNVVKGVRLEGLRVVGDPGELADRYVSDGIDELIYMDIVASLYGRNSLVDVVRRAAERIFVPLTIGGGVRSVADAEILLRAGADKVAVNTAAHARPALLTEIAETFGSQCCVLSVEAQREGSGWTAFTDNGRERTGRDVLEWIREAVDRGAGEVLLTSVDREGTRRGFDCELVSEVADAVRVPIVASGGFGQTDHAVSVVRSGASAVAIADALHHGRTTVAELRYLLLVAGLALRS